MPSLFTRAKAAKKVIDLLEKQLGIPRSQLKCRSRLESDLGVIGADAYDLLEAMHVQGVDMTGFDCADRITPEGIPFLSGMLFIVLGTFISGGITYLAPTWPFWVIYAMAMIASGAVWVFLGRLLSKDCPEIEIRDLVLSFEAGCWKSPKSQMRD